MSDDFEDSSDFVHVGAATPDATALISRIPQAVIRMADEQAPEPQSLFGLPWSQAGVLKAGEDDAAVG